MMDGIDGYDVLAVRELSRFGRSMKQLVEDMNELDNRGVQFVSLNESIDTTSAQGQLMFHIIGAFAEFQAALAAERATRAAERRKEQGKQVGRPPKLSPPEQEQVVEWRDYGHTWGEIQLKVEYEFGEEVSKDTLQRYNKNVKYG